MSRREALTAGGGEVGSLGRARWDGERGNGVGRPGLLRGFAQRGEASGCGGRDPSEP